MAFAERPYEPQQLHELHQEILRQLVLGLKPKEVSQNLGVTTQVVSYVRHGRLGRERLAELGGRRDSDVAVVADRIKELAPHALDTIEEVMGDNGTSANARIRAATDVLDRAGFAAPKRVQAEILHGHFSAEDLAEMRQRAVDAGIMTPVATAESPLVPTAAPQADADSSLCGVATESPMESP